MEKEIDETKRIRKGPPYKDPSEKRNLMVWVRLNESEMKKLDVQRQSVSMGRGEYLRAASLHKIPKIIPEINKKSWLELSRLSSNLNQYQAQINKGLNVPYPKELVLEMISLLSIVRKNLINGIDNESKNN